MSAVQERGRRKVRTGVVVSDAITSPCCTDSAQRRCTTNATRETRTSGGMPRSIACAWALPQSRGPATRGRVKLLRCGAPFATGRNSKVGGAGWTRPTETFGDGGVDIERVHVRDRPDAQERFDVGLPLDTAADDGHRAGLRAREMFRGDGAGGGGPQRSNQGGIEDAERRAEDEDHVGAGQRLTPRAHEQQRMARRRIMTGTRKLPLLRRSSWPSNQLPAGWAHRRGAGGRAESPSRRTS